MNQTYLRNSRNSWPRTRKKVVLSLAESNADSEQSAEPGSGPPSQLEFERFTVYGFSVDYPVDCVLELKPRSTRNEGEVAFKLSGESVFFLSWGPLEKVEKFRGVEGHADYSIGRIKKNREAKIKEIKRERIEVNGHPSPFNHVWIEVVRRGLLFGTSRSSHEIRSLHLHCGNSSRYFMIYVQGTTQLSELQGRVMARMIQSFICH
jgi:hypothetical protein